MMKKNYILAFDSANEVISIGLGRLVERCGDAHAAADNSNTEGDKLVAGHTIEIVATVEIEAHRASNTRLIPEIDALLAGAGISRSQIACIAAGRGPGSFTGVRICLATAKGIASALGVGLIGVSTLDAVAWGNWHAGYRGHLYVAADAMRKEVYPVLYEVDDAGATRLWADKVMKAKLAVDDVARLSKKHKDIKVTGDGLAKYRELFVDGSLCEAGYANCNEKELPSSELKSQTSCDTGDVWSNENELPVSMLNSEISYNAESEGFGEVAKKFEVSNIDEKRLWSSTGTGLLLALQDMWRAGRIDPLCPGKHNPGTVLPVYTRLSDAEETERERLADTSVKNLNSGVQNLGGVSESKDTESKDTESKDAQPKISEFTFEPLDAKDTDRLAAIETEVMGSDAWNSTQFSDELGQANRSWWVAKSRDSEIAGYAGGLIAGDTLEILKVAVMPDERRCGIARRLLSAVANDARDLGATRTYLEVRASNKNAQMFYSCVGLTKQHPRKKYYTDGEDAIIMTGPLPIIKRDVGGMHLRDGENSSLLSESYNRDKESASQELNNEKPICEKLAHPVIFAIESSCDETAAAISCGGEIIADVVASQIDFHKRFGGVVPEIASRKHIEAICGVADECFEQACQALGMPQGVFSWSDLDAVAVTYAPGLVGALVVGMAFAKGAAWAANKPLIGVNHLEGHLYANKLCDKLSGTLSQQHQGRDKLSGNLSQQGRDAIVGNSCSSRCDKLHDEVSHTNGCDKLPDGASHASRCDKLHDGLSHIKMPAVASIISGGNTLLVQVNNWGDYKTLGSTIDDAVGEAFDKVAKALRLGYPGGPIISKLAANGNPKAINFPRAMMRSGDLNFSLSGLKTAVITHIEKHPYEDINDLCASFQAAVIEVQVEKARTAIRKGGARTFMFGGGVAANPALRASYAKMCEDEGVTLVMPPLSATGDNAAMIALVANDRYRAGKFLEWDADVAAHAPLDEEY